MVICADNLVPLIPARLRKTSGALIVTVVVTIQGSARALKHARAPSRPGTNGGAQTESSGSASGFIGIRKQSHRDPQTFEHHRRLFIPEPVVQKAADFKLKGEGSMLEMMTEIFTAAIHTAFPMKKNI